MLGALRRRAAHNGLELSCPAARVTVDSFSRILAGDARSNSPRASRVSCSELLCVRERQADGRSATAPHPQTPPAAHCRSPPPDTSGKTPLSSATRKRARRTTK
jgi:hypothetical protein